MQGGMVLVSSPARKAREAGPSKLSFDARFKRATHLALSHSELGGPVFAGPRRHLSG
jgi:hypothetical protein